MEAQNFEDASSLRDKEKELLDAIVFRLWQSREIYGGLQTRVSARNALILPSETRTVAGLVRCSSCTT